MRKIMTAAVIGAGPVGLAAAAHLTERGVEPVVFEAGADAGAAIREWGHVRLFSPWKYNVDAAARRLLEKGNWTAPDPEGLPTGAELVDRYLTPLARTPELAPRLHLDTEVIAVSRLGVDSSRSLGREGRPYLVRTRAAEGSVVDHVVDAVLDASGTWGHLNPLGSHGLPAPGEDLVAPFSAGPLPDVLGRERGRFEGKTTLVVGMGHSAANTLIDLASLSEEAGAGEILWAIRAATPERVYGGGDADALPARGALGRRLKSLTQSGRVRLIPRFGVERFSTSGDGRLAVTGRSGDEELSVTVDAVAGGVGFRPELEMLRELRLDLDPGVEAPAKLAPLIDPNFHSCGTVPPHGEKDLAHPDEGFYLVGSKSYGRAPTFLLATGYEQVRSIAAALAGDRAAAEDVRLELPETGVCSVGLATGVEHGRSGDEASREPEPAVSGGCCG